MVNEDANAKLIRELKEEILKLRELLKAEGIDVEEGEWPWPLKLDTFVIYLSVDGRQSIDEIKIIQFF